MKERIAIAGGGRTPYVKAGSLFASLTAVDLGRIAVAELLARSNIDPAKIDSVVVGNVAQPVDAVNVARVIALYAGVPRSAPAFTVHRNCASGMQAIISAAQAIRDGKKIVKRTIANLSAWSIEQAEAIRAVLKGRHWRRPMGCLRSFAHAPMGPLNRSARR